MSRTESNIYLPSASHNIKRAREPSTDTTIIKCAAECRIKKFDTSWSITEEAELTRHSTTNSDVCLHHAIKRFSRATMYNHVFIFIDIEKIIRLRDTANSNRSSDYTYHTASLSPREAPLNTGSGSTTKHVKDRIILARKPLYLYICEVHHACVV